MKTLTKGTRVAATFRIEDLLSENCWKCEEATTKNKTWTSVCEECPVFAELRSCGKVLSGPLEQEQSEAAKMRELAKQNGISLPNYHSRVNRGIDPYRAATEPVKSRK